MLKEHFAAGHQPVGIQHCKQIHMGRIAHDVGTDFYLCAGKCQIMRKAARLDCLSQPNNVSIVRAFTADQVGGMDLRMLLPDKLKEKERVVLGVISALCEEPEIPVCGCMTGKYSNEQR